MIKLGEYEHYKGKRYKVIGTARCSETLETLVLYQALYESEEFDSSIPWSRPMSMFLSNVIVDGQEVPRFRYLEKELKEGGNDFKAFEKATEDLFLQAWKHVKQRTPTASRFQNFFAERHNEIFSKFNLQRCSVDWTRENVCLDYLPHYQLEHIRYEFAKPNDFCLINNKPFGMDVRGDYKYVGILDDNAGFLEDKKQGRGFLQKQGKLNKR